MVHDDRPLSPLTGRNDVDFVRRYSVRSLQRRWRSRFGIDIGPELGPIGDLFHWRCRETELQFFTPPDLAGSSELYRQLGRFGWYHEVGRWEFAATLPWLHGANHLLEVGCGNGAFLDLLASGFSGSTVGIELNPETARQAAAKGHHVVRSPIESDQVRSLGPFDAICSFQVLEHVPKPLPFLESLAALLTPGGTLVIGVPNADCFIRHWRVNLLDLPPHHMTRWTRRTLEYIAAPLGLDILSLETETLSAGHSLDYIEAQIRRVLPVPPLPRAIAHVLGPGLRKAAKIRRRIPGHTLLAVYRKRATGE